jgi:hypothetical protein
MSIAKCVRIFSSNSHPERVYAEIKNKNIYRLNVDIHPSHRARFAQLVADADNKLRLKHWTKQ